MSFVKSPSPVTRSLLVLGLLMSLGWLTSVRAAESGGSKIIALVNSDIITDYDIENRTNFHSTNSSQPLTPELRKQIRPQVIQELIDETLQLQEMQRRGVTIGDEDIIATIASIEQDNNMPEGNLLQVLEKNQVSRDSYLRYLKSQLGWSQVVQMRSPAVSPISEAEIDNEQERLRNSYGKPESLVAEIVLLHSTPVSREEHLQQAQYLLQRLKNGADFGKLAQEFSESITGLDSGKIGWVHPKELEPEIDRVIPTLAVNQFSDVITTARGFSIIKILNRRIAMSGDPNAREVTMQRVLFKNSLKVGAVAQTVEPLSREADSLLRRQPNCDDFLAQSLKQGAVNAGRESRKLADLGTEERETVSLLEEAQVSSPIHGNLGTSLIMVCKWSGGEKMPSREQTRTNLNRARFSRQSFKLLRDLQSQAFIEFRSE
ncbi:MAG: peptidylprolyl isomerase [Alphaproteobacteria bacterium]|nr:peptidylprolyl isomerase [Alphaproteobacteria bacterium]